jgi:NCS1 family nucleobase:cation symporter-1
VFIYAGSLQSNFNDILTGVGALIAPYWGVALGDYFLVRRQRLDLVALYQRETSVYWYRRGFNPTALGVWVCGVALWVFLGGWQSTISWMHIDAGEPYFNKLTATAPVIVLTALAYWGVMRIRLARALQDMPAGSTAVHDGALVTTTTAGEQQ